MWGTARRALHAQPTAPARALSECFVPARPQLSSARAVRAPPPAARRTAPAGGVNGHAPRPRRVERPRGEQGAGATDTGVRVELCEQLGAQAVTSLQARLSNCAPEQRAELVSALMPLVDEMCDSDRGPYLLQAMITAAAPTPFLMQELAHRCSGRFVTLALDEHGFYVARELIFHLDADWALTREITHERLLPAAAELSRSCTGARILNYAFRRNLLDDDGRRRLAAAITPHVHAVCREKHGSRLVRSLIADARGGAEVLFAPLLDAAASLVTDEYGASVLRTLLDSPTSPRSSRAAFMAALEPHALRLATDVVARTALQACLLAPRAAVSGESPCADDALADDQRRRLAERIVAGGAQLATDAFGSCVLQAALFHDVAGRRAMVSQLIDRAEELAVDRFGNYVLQHAIARAAPIERVRACSLLARACVRLAQDKHASFALQGALRCMSREEGATLEAALFASAVDLARERISSLVLQQLLRRMPAAERGAFVDKHLLPCVPELMGIGHAVVVLHECAAVSERVACAMRVELERVERLIDEFAESDRCVLELPLELSAFQRKRAHQHVRRFGSALVSVSIGDTEETRTLHVFKSEGVRARPLQPQENDELGYESVFG